MKKTIVVLEAKVVELEAEQGLEEKTYLE